MTSGPLNRPIEIDIRSTITQTINQTQIEHINKKNCHSSTAKIIRFYQFVLNEFKRKRG